MPEPKQRTSHRACAHQWATTQRKLGDVPIKGEEIAATCTHCGEQRTWEFYSNHHKEKANEAVN